MTSSLVFEFFRYMSCTFRSPALLGMLGSWSGANKYWPPASDGLADRWFYCQLYGSSFYITTIVVGLLTLWVMAIHNHPHARCTQSQYFHEFIIFNISGLYCKIDSVRQSLHCFLVMFLTQNWILSSDTAYLQFRIYNFHPSFLPSFFNQCVPITQVLPLLS